MRMPLIFLIASLGAGCIQGNNTQMESPAPAPAQARALDNGQVSLRALAELALQAAAAGDAVALNSLRVTEREYKEHFFPELPEAGPTHNIPVEFHWYHLNLRSLKGLQDVIDEHAGQRYELLDVFATQGAQDFKTFRAHRKVELKVRRAPDGAEAQIRLFGSVLERNGEFKILSFPS